MTVARRFAVFLICCGFVAAPLAAARWKLESSGKSMTAAAQTFLAALTPEQREQALLAYDSPRRVDWHFIPKAERKGVQMRHLTETQRTQALALLRTCLSAVGYDKAVKIMTLEQLLRALEADRRGGPLRDELRYYVTLFGEPAEKTKWGLSIEGHHLSLNFVVDQGKVISCSPIALCTNPAVVQESSIASIPKGLRVLAAEEELAFALLHSLTPEQQKTAIFAEKPLAEVRAAGAPQPPREAPVGIALAKLSAQQQQQLQKLVDVYLGNLPDDVAAEHRAAFQPDDWQTVHFGWAGATKPGSGHYYRIEGRSFLVELVNTQPDAAGNPANHVHCVWRNMRGDFALPLEN